MQGKFNVITLCGSTRFRAEYERVQKELTLQGNIVISVGLFGHSGDDEVWKDGVKEMLDEMHLAKIDMADEIFVINPGGYIGQSTSREIAYARSRGKDSVSSNGRRERKSLPAALSAWIIQPHRLPSGFWKARRKVVPYLHP